LAFQTSQVLQKTLGIRQAKKNQIRRTVMKRTIIVLLVWILVMALGVLLLGCQTIKGAAGDTAWLLQKGADNIQTEK